MVIPLKLSLTLKKKNYLAAYPIHGKLRAEEVLLRDCRILDQQTHKFIGKTIRSRRNLRECIAHIHNGVIYNTPPHHQHQCSKFPAHFLQQKQKKTENLPLNLKNRILELTGSEEAMYVGNKVLTNTDLDKSRTHEFLTPQESVKINKNRAESSVPLPRTEDLPLNLKNRIRELNGSEAAYVGNKVLTKTDLDRSQGRLLVPFSRVKTHEFLTPQESEIINKNRAESSAPVPGIVVRVMEPNGLAGSELIMKKWDMPKSANYAFIGGWSSLALRNGLNKDMVLHIWSFRVGSQLWFALVV